MAILKGPLSNSLTSELAGRSQVASAWPDLERQSVLSELSLVICASIDTPTFVLSPFC